MLPMLQSPSLAPAFDNIMPAILGAVSAPVLIKNLKLSSVPCILAAGLVLTFGYPAVAAKQAYLMPVFLVIAVAWSYVLFKQDSAKKAKQD